MCSRTDRQEDSKWELGDYASSLSNDLIWDPTRQEASPGKLVLRIKEIRDENPSGGESLQLLQMKLSLLLVRKANGHIESILL